MANYGKVLLGETDDGQTVGLSPKDRRNHIHVIGASNKGKSKFMENLIRADLLNSSVGACVIDPHGLLVDDILLWVSHLAPHLAKRIVVFEPAANTEFVTGFNPIPRSYDSLSATVYGIIDSILYAWGQGGEVFPRLRPQLYNVLNPLLANKLTLVEALAMFSPHHKAERERLVDRISDPNIRAAWEVLSRVSNTEEYRLLEGVINRFSALLNSEYMRRVLSVEENSIDIGQIMAEKKILLVSLRNHRNRIHGDNLRMLGTMILTEIYRVGMLRNEHDQPPPFHVYIDEFGQYTTPVVAKALDEIRKKSVYLTVAHQHLAQLLKDDTGVELLSSIMTNCLVRVAFGGLTPQDADIMTRRMWTPHIDLKEIKHQQFGTKTRHIEETRTSVTKGRSVADGTSHTDSRSTNWSDGYSDGTSESETDTHTEGGSQSRSRTDVKARSSGTAWNAGETQSHTAGGALSKGSSRADGTNSSSSRTTGTSNTVGDAETRSSNRSSSSGTSSSASSSSGESQYSLGEGVTASIGHNSGTSESSSSSESEGESRSRSNSRTTSDSNTVGSGTSRTDTKSLNETRSYSDTDGTSSSRGGSQTSSASQSLGHMEGTSHSDAHAHSHGSTHTESHTEGGSQGSSDGTSHTETTSESETTSPFHRIEEYQEETSRSFYSLPEQFHRKTGALMALGQGTALYQFDGSVPAELRTKRLDDVPYLKYGRARKLERCRQRMIEANARYYTTVPEIEKAAIERQLRAFEKPLAYEDVNLEDYEIVIDDSGFEDGFNTQ
jgi:hypothetical protein